MGSLSISEILTILVIILIIFGPKRLPEFARKVGQIIAWSRKSMAEFTASMQDEFGEGMAPLTEIKQEFEGAQQDLSEVVTTFTGAASSKDADEPTEATDSEEPDASNDADTEDEIPDAVRRFQELRQAEIGQPDEADDDEDSPAAGTA